jgi:hypothetical protein
MAVSVTNSLSKLARAVARQWHPTKNGALRARDVTAGSHRVVWWKCPEGPDHEWRTSVVKRVLGTRCPFCCGRRVSASSNLAVVLPHLVPEWHPTMNDAVRPEDVLPGTTRSFWWRCARGHVWSARVDKRAMGRGCPFCAGKRVAPETSLAARHPGLAKEWHPRKNGRLTPRDVTAGSPRRAWWRCRKGAGHEWEASIAARRSTGCPFCTNRRVSATNSLAARSPKLAREWHPTKNGSLGPRDVTPGVRRRVWWRCAFGHAWQALVYARAGQGSGCPECSRLRRKQPVATTGKRREQVRLAAYAGARHGPVRRVR